MKRLKGFDLEKAVARKQLTRDGKEWLTLALDPFHDWNVPVAGYPDADCSNTVVQCFQYQADLVSPNANWDCHVYINPAVSGCVEYECKNAAVNRPAETAGNAPAAAGLLNIVRVDSGQLLCPSGTAAWAPTNLAQQTLGDYTDIAVAGSRVIGMGFEVINTSAEIYKQGAITCYKMPSNYTMTSVMQSNAADNSLASNSARMYKLPPSTTAIATKLHGTVTWEAGKGAYIVCTQNSTNNDITGLTFDSTVRHVAGTMASGNMCYASAMTYYSAAKPTLATLANNVKHVPFNIHGAMITGLGTNSTIRVRFRVYVERAPSINSTDSDLVVLATPSAGYDASALKVYSEVVARMPVAVPVDFNSFGDWWKIISGIAKAVAVPIGSLIGGPAGAAVGGVAAGALTGVDQVFREKPALRGAGPVPEAYNPGSKAFKKDAFESFPPKPFPPTKKKPRRAPRQAKK